MLLQLPQAACCQLSLATQSANACDWLGHCYAQMRQLAVLHSGTFDVVLPKRRPILMAAAAAQQAISGLEVACSCFVAVVWLVLHCNHREAAVASVHEPSLLWSTQCHRSTSVLSYTMKGIPQQRPVQANGVLPSLGNTRAPRSVTLSRCKRASRYTCLPGIGEICPLQARATTHASLSCP